MVGAMLTNIANMLVDQLSKREFPDGVRVTATGALSPDAPVGTEKYRRYFTVMRLLNRILVAGPIGFTPFVNFNVLRSYRPGTMYRLFS